MEIYDRSNPCITRPPTQDDTVDNYVFANIYTKPNGIKDWSQYNWFIVAEHYGKNRIVPWYHTPELITKYTLNLCRPMI
jgi:hypothetical protein